jgi:octaprenyl-diphosphate synthase
VELGSYSETIIKDIANGVVKLSMGEIADVNLSKEFNSDENLYLNMIYNKTASLIEVACRVSAIHSGKDGVKFGEYGKWLGMAFQIIDDILDIVSTSEELGKPAMNDFIEGKTTLPYIYLYKEAPHLREKVKSFHLKTLSEDEQEWIKEQFEESGSLEKAMDLAIEFSEKAIKNLEKENGELLDIVQNLIERKK